MQPLVSDSPFGAITCKAVSLVFAETVVVYFVVSLSVWTMMVRESINLDAEYLYRYCDSRTNLVPHALKLLNICTTVASYPDIEKILNVGFCILRGSQKSSAKELYHRIESINAKLMK
ncbi:hypothetical protein RDI58_014892 [Solanum bulbocastanum]|uniref:Uncharacterized protein n=1 Tax=Solanum bulbocastanum TaxID=147425 RepID=A0AAN8TJU4_SOLBU